MTEIRLYNTLTRRKDDFTPVNKERVTMYVCGPTVYNRAHIGNARPAVVFDVLARLLRHIYGAEHVVYARNITDIEDKIMAAAEAEGVPIGTITARYEQHYLDDMGALGVQPPDIAPHATDHLPQMIAMMARLIDGGHAYVAEGHVLFDVGSDASYGELSRRPMDDMIAGARVEVAPYKKNAADFVLWKPSADDQPGWESPWGRGRPGWHIECSAMIEEHLGQTIDIHAGGQDLIFPHHENEIAQSRCSHDGAPLARFWLHNGFLSMDKEKMSKSLGNVVTVGDLLEQGHKGEVLRLALLMAHYRQPLDWNDRLLEQAKAMLDRWYRLIEDSNDMRAEPDAGFIAELADDLNTPAAIARLAKLASSRDTASLIATANFIGLLKQDPDVWAGRVNAKPGTAHIIIKGLTPTVVIEISAKRVEELLAARTAAKAAKNWAEADRIRADLLEEGIVLEDGPDGTTWRRA